MQLIILVTVIASTLSQVATPPRKVGFSYIRRHPSARIHLEVFLDLLCPHSKVTWPRVKDVADFYGPENVALTVHLFPLPYHQNSFYATRAAFVIHYMTNGSKTFDWIDKILLDMLPELTDTSFHDKSDADLLELFAGYVTEMGIDATSFRQLVDRRTSNQFEKYTRVMWKHACVRGVAGTPTYIVNGIIQPNVSPSWELANWTDFIEPLLADQLFDSIDNVTDSQHHLVPPTSCTEKQAGSTSAPLVTRCRITVLALAFLVWYNV